MIKCTITIINKGVKFTTFFKYANDLIHANSMPIEYPINLTATEESSAKTEIYV